MMDRHSDREPLISVMMPARNAAEYLAATLESVIAQTYPHWELIFVDDGSCDGTLDIAASFASKDARIKVSSIEFGGRGIARNKCLEQCTGEFVAICDADDICVPTRFAQQVQYLLEHPSVGVVGSAWIPFTGTLPVKMKPILIYAKNAEEVATSFNAGKMRIHNATVMYRRSLVERCGGYHPALKRAQDYGFFLRLHRAGIKFDVLPQPLVYYRQASTAHSLAYFSESNLYIRYADALVAGSSASFEEFIASGRGRILSVGYKLKYFYYWLKVWSRVLLRA